MARFMYDRRILGEEWGTINRSEEIFGALEYVAIGSAVGIDVGGLCCPR